MNAMPTRAKVLEAAARLFVEHGYIGTSMDQVRQLAGVSNGSLYHHFPTKAVLADALYVDTLHGFHAALLAPIANDAGAEEGVKALVRAHVSWVTKHPDRASLLHKLKRDGDVTETSEGISGANTKVFGALKAWIRGRTEVGDMRALPFHVWMALVFGPAMSLTGRWVNGPCVTQKEREALERAAWSAVAP
jgi:AcrR family transcriptional regulator